MNIAEQDERLRDEVRMASCAGQPAAGPTPEFVASVGVPSLHWLARNALPRPVGGSAKAADADPGADANANANANANDGLGAGEREQLVRNARDCLSDLAALSSLRRPLGELPWATVEAFEQRLLAALDALLALGQPLCPGSSVGWHVLDEVQRYWAEAFVPDPGREFARAFTLCCIDGDDAVAAALLGLRQAPSSVYPAFRDALVLAPNPHIGRFLTELLPSASGDLLLLLLEILRQRREATFSSLVPLSAHLDAAVLAAASRGLGYVACSEGVLRTLHRIIEQEEDDVVAVEAATSLLLHGDTGGLSLARGRLEDVALLSEKGRLGLLRLIALAGAASDLDLVRQSIAPTVRDAELMGWFGHVGLLPWLLATLREANAARESTRPWPHPLEIAVSHALFRITGAPLHDAEDSGLPYESATLPALSAELWAQWWQEKSSSMPVGVKLRFGQLYEPRATLDELLGDSFAAWRADGALELGIVVGASRFEPGDWVHRQRSVLGALKTELDAVCGGYVPGRFPADQLARRPIYAGEPRDPGQRNAGR